MAVSSASRIISVKEFCRCSEVSSTWLTNESLMVSRQAACLPSTWALWKRAKLSISTQSLPVRSAMSCQVPCDGSE